MFGTGFCRSCKLEKRASGKNIAVWNICEFICGPSAHLTRAKMPFARNMTPRSVDRALRRHESGPAAERHLEGSAHLVVEPGVTAADGDYEVVIVWADFE